MRIILLGPPGAGKGTQAESIRRRWNIAYISTGDILRANVKTGTELGRSAKDYMAAGKLVPDEVIIAMMELRLQEPDAESGFLLDGFPRTVGQAEALDALLSRLGLKLDVVVELEVPDDVVVRRLSSRRVCRQCGEIYNTTAKPAKHGDVCDKCSGEVIQRDDDTEEVIRERLAVFHDQTAPLIEYYRDKGALLKVDATGAKDAVVELLEGSFGR